MGIEVAGRRNGRIIATYGYQAKSGELLLKSSDSTELIAAALVVAPLSPGQRICTDADPAPPSGRCAYGA
jgi:hypothetical protein